MAVLAGLGPGRNSVRQYRVDLDGDSTVADFAYPDDKVLIYVDGLSRAIHGNKRQRLGDKIRRAKAENKGYRVFSISAQALHDSTPVGEFLAELAVKLERHDLLTDDL